MSKNRYKKRKIENIIYKLSIIILIIFSIEILLVLVTKNDEIILAVFKKILLITRVILPLSLIIIIYFRNKRGYNKPTSIEAMRDAQKDIPDKIYKYCSLSSDKNDALNNKKLDSLKNNQIWLSDFSSLNDPFEGMFCLIDDENDKECNKFLKDQLLHSRDDYIQASFSYNNNNVLMWGHYANGCRGFCVEYSVLFKDYLFPVIYTKERPLLSSLSSDDRVINSLSSIERSSDKAKDVKEFLKYFLFIQSIKSDVWAYEQEVRVIEFGQATRTSKSGNVNINDYGLEVSKIIIGYQCLYKQELIEIARVLNIPYSIMEISLKSEDYSLIENDSD